MFASTSAPTSASTSVTVATHGLVFWTSRESLENKYDVMTTTCDTDCRRVMRHGMMAARQTPPLPTATIIEQFMLTFRNMPICCFVDDEWVDPLRFIAMATRSHYVVRDMAVSVLRCEPARKLFVSAIVSDDASLMYRAYSCARVLRIAIAVSDPAKASRFPTTISDPPRPSPRPREAKTDKTDTSPKWILVDGATVAAAALQGGIISPLLSRLSHFTFHAADTGVSKDIRTQHIGELHDAREEAQRCRARALHALACDVRHLRDGPARDVSAGVDALLLAADGRRQPRWAIRHGFAPRMSTERYIASDELTIAELASIAFVAIDTCANSLAGPLRDHMYALLAARVSSVSETFIGMPDLQMLLAVVCSSRWSSTGIRLFFPPPVSILGRLDEDIIIIKTARPSVAVTPPPPHGELSSRSNSQRQSLSKGDKSSAITVLTPATATVPAKRARHKRAAKASAASSAHGGADKRQAQSPSEPQEATMPFRNNYIELLARCARSIEQSGGNIEAVEAAALLAAAMLRPLVTLSQIQQSLAGPVCTQLLLAVDYHIVYRKPRPPTAYRHFIILAELVSFAMRVADVSQTSPAVTRVRAARAVAVCATFAIRAASIIDIDLPRRPRADGQHTVITVDNLVHVAHQVVLQMSYCQNASLSLLFIQTIFTCGRGTEIENFARNVMSAIIIPTLDSDSKPCSTRVAPLLFAAKLCCDIATSCAPRYMPSASVLSGPHGPQPQALLISEPYVDRRRLFGLLCDMLSNTPLCEALWSVACVAIESFADVAKHLPATELNAIIVAVTTLRTILSHGVDTRTAYPDASSSSSASTIADTRRPELPLTDKIRCLIPPEVLRGMSAEHLPEHSVGGAGTDLREFLSRRCLHSSCHASIVKSCAETLCAAITEKAERYRRDPITMSCALCLNYAPNVCSGCRIAYYCSKECQRADFSRHKMCCSNSLR